jgi:hypothetical protein
VDGIAVLVTVTGGESSITCPSCASQNVERALTAGIDERCILIQQAGADPLLVAHPDAEQTARRNWPKWADKRIPVSDPTW